LRNLIDFNRYLRRLVDEFEQDGLDRPGEPAPIKYYVELEAEIQDTKKKKSALDLIEAWISRTGGPQLALLGEYGSGKTTLCKKLAYDLAKGFLQAKRKGNHRIPILVPLLEFPRGRADIEAFVTGHLARRCGVSNPSFEAFKAMNDEGFLLLIFDGLDEMAVHVDEEVINANLAQIEQLAVSPSSRVLLSSRPEYFKTTQEEQQALQPTGLLARRSHYTILNLCGFTEKQIRAYLQKRIPTSTNSTQDWSYYYNEIKRIHDLSDLSTRPVLLEMIAKTLPQLMASEQPVDRPLLYQTYLMGELQRQSVEKRRGLLIRLEDRLRMMQTLALHFYLEAPIGLTADLVQVLVHDQFSPEQLDELEAHTRDFLTCSFLTRKGDIFAFSHRSFVEYLTARALLEEIESNSPNHFGGRKLTREVIEFLAEMRPNLDVLRGWIEATRYRGFETVQYLGTNAVTILVKLGEDLSCSDFSGTVLNEADLRHGVFEKSVFAQASLSRVDLTGATLDHCNFAEADLTKARLISVKARECNLKGAFFDLTDLTGADLTGSDLSDCIFYEANFQDVVVDNCIVRGLDGVLNPIPFK
jgi:hypothetical protein